MNKLDWIIAVILLIGAFSGYRNGFLMGLVSLLAIVLGVFGGFKLMGEGMELLHKHFNADQSVLPYLSFIIIFVAIVILVHMIGRTLKASIDKTFLGRLDAAMGALLGLVKTTFLLSVVFWILDSLKISPGLEWTDDSRLFPFVATFAPELAGWVAQFLPFFKEIFKQF
ncbi:MAG: CvpA family protein [Cyclobacteriaceae bacterium]